MLTTIYSLSFIIAATALASWFFVKDNPAWSKLFQRLVLGGLFAYGTSIALSGAPLEDIFSRVFQDLLVIGTTGLAFLALAQKRAAFIAGLIVLIGALGWYYNNQLKDAFIPNLTLNRDIPIDENGELLLELKEGVVISELQSIIQKYNLKATLAFNPVDKASTDLDDYYVIDIPKKYFNKLEQIKADLQASNLIDWQEENEVISVAPIAPPPTTRNPMREDYGINDPGLDELWGFSAMRVNQLYEYLQSQNIQPKQKALVVICDTGVDAKHTDLRGNYKSIKKKHDNDPRGHGTHCAGIAGAVTNNNEGIASFSTDNSFIQIASVKVLSASGFGTQKSIIDGILEAADNGAAVISLSLGGRSNSSKQTAYNKAVKYALEKGAIVVAAAGNSNMNSKDYAPVNAKGIIGVSAINESLERAPFSNYVNDIKMGIAAPGVNIYSTIPGNKYQKFNGTSMATPYVAGLIGLMKSLDPSLTNTEVYNLLHDNGIPTRNVEATGNLIYPYQTIKSLVEK